MRMPIPLKRAQGYQQNLGFIETLWHSIKNAGAEATMQLCRMARRLIKRSN
jgi:hypothetical protein